MSKRNTVSIHLLRAAEKHGRSRANSLERSYRNTLHKLDTALAELKAMRPYAKRSGWNGKAYKAKLAAERAARVAAYQAELRTTFATQQKRREADLRRMNIKDKRTLAQKLTEFVNSPTVNEYERVKALAMLTALGGPVPPPVEMDIFKGLFS
jgi:hypothetical protein